jgi:hypothetical protein
VATPEITIIVPVHNARDYLRDAVPRHAGPERRAKAAPTSAPAVTLEMPIGSLMTAALQATDDVVVGEDRAASFSHSHRQPAVLLEIRGTSPVVVPLLQVAPYDINHSLLSTLGVAMAFGGFTMHGDLILDFHNQAPSYDRRNVTRYRTVVVDASYAFAKWDLFGKVLGMDAVQPSSGGQADHRGNEPGIEFDDNEASGAFGARYHLDGDAFVPFAAVLERSGRFLRSAEDVTGATHVKRGVEWHLGLTCRL